MTDIDFAVRQWAARGAVRTESELAMVIVAVQAAWHDGVPTREALEYARRRVAHFKARVVN